ncbi:MAG: hypothetical protein AAF298_23405 [Cyanobacteria bacterium P01_A01_bin.40]
MLLFAVPLEFFGKIFSVFFLINKYCLPPSTDFPVTGGMLRSRNRLTILLGEV